MLKSYLSAALMAVVMWQASEAVAQHCAPIVESYLQSVLVKHTDDGIAFDIEYKKTGGQNKASYQAYLLVYSDADAGRIELMSPQEAIESKLVSVVHTQLAKRQDNGCYRIECALKTQAFVGDMLKDSRLDREQVDNLGGWKAFQGKLRFAVFVPFLDDSKYSVIEGLPENKHECNYRNESGLIFETLSQTLSVHFGIVQAVRVPEDQYYIQINGQRANLQRKRDQ